MFLNLVDIAPFYRPAPTPTMQDVGPIRARRFEDLLTPAEWARLPKAIQDRFAGHVAIGQSRLYAGRIINTHLTFWGQMLAHLLIPFGAPLPLDETKGGEAAIVAVTAEHAKSGQDAQVWTRQYSRTKGFPQTILSTKRFEGDTGLEERLGPGLGQCIGIALTLKTEPTALHFISARYFLWLWGKRFYLPKWMEPGQMIVSHELVGDSQFIFRLKLAHPKLGLLVEQACLFSDTTEV